VALLSDPDVLAMLLLAAGLAGFIDAIAGGGGMITLPALLTVGMPPHLALGTNKLAGTFGTFNAARIFIRKGIFRPALWRAAFLATFIGALLGTLCTRLVSAEAFNKFLPVLVIVAAIYVAIPKRRPGRVPAPPSHAAPTLASTLLGTTLGFYDGFTGPGAGAFWTALAMRVFHIDLVSAAGVARAMNFVSNSIALVTFMLLGSVDYRIGLMMGVALMIGAYIGAHSAIRYGAGFIKPVFVTVVVLLSIRLAWLEWFQSAA
jgi:uncharacterized membrane protein YfcA